MTLPDYLQHLEPEDRAIAREWGTMDSGEFQARVGPEVERLATLLERQNGQWYNLRIGDLGRMVGGFVSGFFAAGGQSGL